MNKFYYFVICSIRLILMIIIKHIFREIKILYRYFFLKKIKLRASLLKQVTIGD